MLRWITHIGGISYHRLMAVYEESIAGNAHELYEHFDTRVAIQYAEQDLYTYLDTVFFKTPGAALAVWEEEGKYMSVLRIEFFRDGALITALETAPTERSKGYGLKLLQGVIGEWKKFPIYSHVRRDNLPSMRCHEKCGFTTSAEPAVFLDGSLHPECVTLRHDGGARAFSQGDG